VIDSLQYLPAPQGYGITALQVSDPINHQAHGFVYFGLESRTAKLSSDVAQYWIKPSHVDDDEDAQEML